MATDIIPAWEERDAVFAQFLAGADGDYDLDFGRAGVSGLAVEVITSGLGTTAIAVKETLTDGTPADPVLDAEGAAISITSASARVTTLSDGSRLIRKLRFTVSTYQAGPHTVTVYGKRRQ